MRAIFRKELREYKRNSSVVAAMAIIPLIFLIQPLVTVLTLATAAAGPLSHKDPLLYLLGIPAIVPTTIAAYAVVGERQQGTLEPLLESPIRREELLLGKALASFVPSVAIAYAVYALFIAIVELFSHPGIAPALIHGQGLIAQIVFTPLIAAWSIWVGIAISARTSDVRTAQQLAMLASLPTVAVTTLIAYNVIRPSLQLAVALAAALLVLDRLGWRAASAAFDRERLITNIR